MFDIIQNAFQVVTHIANERQLKLVKPKVEPSQEHFYSQIYGDPNRMTQVLINFLNNSIKFSKRGGQVQVHLEILEYQKKQTTKKVNNFFFNNRYPQHSQVIRRHSSELDINALRRCSPSFGNFPHGRNFKSQFLDQPLSAVQREEESKEPPQSHDGNPNFHVLDDSGLELEQQCYMKFKMTI